MIRRRRATSPVTASRPGRQFAPPAPFRKRQIPWRHPATLGETPRDIPTRRETPRYAATSRDTPAHFRRRPPTRRSQVIATGSPRDAATCAAPLPDHRESYSLAKERGPQPRCPVLILPHHELDVKRNPPIFFSAPRQRRHGPPHAQRVHSATMTPPMSPPLPRASRPLPAIAAALLALAPVACEPTPPQPAPKPPTPQATPSAPAPPPPVLGRINTPALPQPGTSAVLA